MVCWPATLEKYDYKFIHRKGSQHSNADALSCLPLRKCPREDCPQCTLQVCPVTARPEPAEPDEWLLGWTNQELSQWQRNDPVLSKVIKWLEPSPERPKNAAQYNGLTRSYLTQWESLCLNGQGILCREWVPQSRQGSEQAVMQIVAPREIRKRILQSLHNSPTGGYLGEDCQ